MQQASLRDAKEMHAGIIKSYKRRCTQASLSDTKETHAGFTERHKGDARRLY
jgi:hypothetical protein